MEFALASGISATEASTQRYGIALGRWHCAGKHLLLTFPRRPMERDWERTGTCDLLARTLAGEFAPISTGDH